MLARGLLSAAPLCSMTCRLQASVLAKGALVAWAEVRRTEPGLCSSSAKVEEEGQKQNAGSKECRTRAQLLRRKYTGKVCHWKGTPADCWAWPPFAAVLVRVLEVAWVPLRPM